MDHIDLLNDARTRIFARLDLLAEPKHTPTPEEVGPTDWVYGIPLICDFCRGRVAYRDSKIEVEALDYGGRPVYYGQATSLEVRVCSWH